MEKRGEDVDKRRESEGNGRSRLRGHKRMGGWMRMVLMEEVMVVER